MTGRCRLEGTSCGGQTAKKDWFIYYYFKSCIVQDVCGVATWSEYVDRAGIILTETFYATAPVVTFVGVFVVVIYFHLNVPEGSRTKPFIAPLSHVWFVVHFVWCLQPAWNSWIQTNTHCHFHVPQTAKRKQSQLKQSRNSFDAQIRRRWWMCHFFVFSSVILLYRSHHVDSARHSQVQKQTGEQTK